MKIELTKTQRESIEYNSGDLLVKGVAGSGKSIVLIQRALLLNKKAIEENQLRRIMILTFANSLVKYSKEIIEQSPLTPNMIEINTIGKYCYNMYRDLTKTKYIKINDDPIKLIKAALQKHLELSKKEHRFHAIDPEFWEEEFKWIKQRVYTSSDKYINAERTGRGNKVKMSRDDKVIAYQLFTIYSDLLKRQHLFDWDDFYIYLLRNGNQIPESMKCDYIMVDEAQDLSYAQLKTAKMLAKTAVTIAADKAQKIYNTSFTWKELGIDIKGRGSKSLEKSFRSTKQIVQLAESLLATNRATQEDQSDFTEPIMPEREGAIPSIVVCKDSVDENDFIIELLRRNYENNTVGVLYRSSSERSKILRWLYNAGLPYEEIKNNQEWSLNTLGIKLSTLHSSKGLEFDVIIIPMFIESVYPMKNLLRNLDEKQVQETMSQERSLLYVGMTRAKYELYFTCSGSPSIFINDFDPQFYQYLHTNGQSLDKPVRQFTFNENKHSEKIDTNGIRNGASVSAHLKGEPKIITITIDVLKFPFQKSFLGKMQGENVNIFSKNYIIDNFENN